VNQGRIALTNLLT